MTEIVFECVTKAKRMSNHSIVNGWIYNHCLIDRFVTIMHNWSKSQILQKRIDESLTNVKLVSNEPSIYIETQVWPICWSNFYV